MGGGKKFTPRPPPHLKNTFKKPSFIIVNMLLRSFKNAKDFIKPRVSNNIGLQVNSYQIIRTLSIIDKLKY